MTTEQKSINAIKWLTALLSGEYKQGYGQLGDKIQGFCCWGLGCFIVGLNYKNYADWNEELADHIGFLEKEGFINPPIETNNTLNLSQIRGLADLNDSAKWTFKEIAEYLILHAETNFETEVATAIKLHFKK